MHSHSVVALQFNLYIALHAYVPYLSMSLEFIILTTGYPASLGSGLTRSRVCHVIRAEKPAYQGHSIQVLQSNRKTGLERVKLAFTLVAL